MIKIATFLLLTALIAAGCKNNNIEINGKLLAPANGVFLYLDELRSTELITVDSAIIEEDGTFLFRRKIEYPSFYLIKTDETNFLTMLLEPGQNITVKSYQDSLNYPASITGSKGTELMNEYNKRLLKTINQLKKLYDVYIQNLGADQLAVVMDRLDSLAQIQIDDLNRYTKEYIDNNLNSLVSLVALYQQVAPGEYILHPEKDIEYFIKVDSSLSRLYPDYEPVKSLHEQVQGLKSEIEAQKLRSPVLYESVQAPEIALPDTEGDTVKLSSTRGNIVLLDFWAAWCKPCRDENPNLVDAYDKYHNRGFQIYQVSLDKTKEAWIKGIREDNLDRWIHVSDLKYWQSVVVPLYKLEQIPNNFLLDREGRVIASNLRGEMLQRKLAELFKN
ncbi:MAG: AhpC/TSA family protein [Bacteroidales bacterium]|jgi:peroxiredoxin|nr:AhpC/TSA family protein [Bacteroidales bacterium]